MQRVQNCYTEEWKINRENNLTRDDYRGDIWPQGPWGAKDAKWDKGDRGPKSVRGDQCHMGSRGSKGLKVDQGPMVNRGLKVEQGPVGLLCMMRDV